MPTLAVTMALQSRSVDWQTLNSEQPRLPLTLRSILFGNQVE